MFFTRIGTLIAWLALLLGAARVGVAVFIATQSQNAAEAAAFTARYFGSKTTGEVIDQSALVMALAVALGILAEMSWSVRRVE